MDESPLGRLPPELRLAIYEHALAQDDEIELKLKYYRGKPALRAGNTKVHSLALTATCKQIRQESKDLFYDLNSFELVPLPTASDPTQRKWALGTRAFIKRVRFIC